MTDPPAGAGRHRRLSPWDESVAVGVSGEQSRSLVAFLSTGCGMCAGFWDELNQPVALGFP